MKLIPIEDGFPKMETQCVVTDEYSYHLVEYIGEGKWKDLWSPDIFGINEERFFGSDSPITHYIPLPKLPLDVERPVPLQL